MMLKPRFAILLLSLFCAFSAHATTVNETSNEGFYPAPSPMELIRVISHYFNGDIASQQLFDQSAAAHMRIAMEHLEVRFSDRRTNTEISREAIEKILGQSRQDNAHDFIRQTLTRFSLPYLNAEQIVDLFNAAALASMPSPPEYIAIEFYDARYGPSNKKYGGIRASLPDAMYAPSKAQAADAISAWDDEAIADYFIANDVSFKPSNAQEFLLPYSAVADDSKQLEHYAREELQQLLEQEPNLKIALADQQKVFIKHVALSSIKQRRYYIGLLYLKAEDPDKASIMRERFAKLYAD